MKAAHTQTPIHYRQPDQNEDSRNLYNTLEVVNYMPESQTRIWYNYQNDGYPQHHHDALEVILCIENCYTIIANGKTYELNVGDILFIPPHMLHELIAPEEGTRFICLFDIDMLNQLHDFKTMDPIFMNAFLCNAITCPGIYQDVYASFTKIFDIYFSNPIFWETQIFSVLIRIFSLIGSNYFQKSSKSSLTNDQDKTREHYEKITSLLSYIDANYATDIALEQAADYIGFSKYHFSRLFKQYTNTTFYDYLCHKRVQAAQYLLSTDASITDIAFQVGFNNLTTFCRCFKKLTNCSPTEYRNKFQQEADY